jgi:N-acetyltransferase
VVEILVTDRLRDLVLRGQTVTLRPLTAEDADALVMAASESREHYGYTRVPDGAEDARRYIEVALADRDAGRRLPFVILWQERVVGSTSYLDVQRWRWPPGSPLQRTDHPDAVEIGSTWLAASAQRTRCNTEAKHLLLSHAFDVWRVHRVALKTDERNHRSRRAIERLGARFDGVRRADMPGQDGTVRNSAYYSIVRSEWPEVRARLQAALAVETGPRRAS